jgi:Calcineurin-like phosphoesterase
MYRRWLCGWLLAALTSAATAAAADSPAAPTSPWRWNGVERVVAFGDVHGAYDQLVTVLQSEGVIDAALNWSAGDAHLVSVGDLLDRGPRSRDVMDLLIRLQQQAAAAGGAVHVVLGNHELMNLSGDLRYLVAADYAQFAAAVDPLQRDAGFARYLRTQPADASTEQARRSFDAKFPPGYFARQEAFAADGRYGAWLLAQPAVIVINDTAYLHGGLPAVVGDSSLDALNEHFRRDLTALLAAQAQAREDDEPVPDAEQSSPLFGADGPLWYRGTALCHALIEAPRVDRGLAALHAERAVIGHTPTSDRRVQTRFDGRVVMIDTGMLTSYYQGRPAGLAIEDATLRVRYAETDQVVAPEPADEAGLAGWDRPALEAFLANAPIVETRRIERGGVTEYALRLDDGARQRSATFVVMDAKRAAGELAAYRLDVLLGLGLVPVTVRRRVDSDTGIIAAAPDHVLTEAERRSAEQVRPNWCESGNDYQLMYVFDALIGDRGRTIDDIAYDRASWRLQLRNNGRAFPTSRKLPSMPKGVEMILPAALADKLAGLDFGQLQRALGDVLNTRQLEALLARRDELLISWRQSS